MKIENNESQKMSVNIFNTKFNIYALLANIFNTKFNIYALLANIGYGLIMSGVVLAILNYDSPRDVCMILLGYLILDHVETVRIVENYFLNFLIGFIISVLCFSVLYSVLIVLA